MRRLIIASLLALPLVAAGLLGSLSNAQPVGSLASSKPYIISKPIPYSNARRNGMAAYSRARYGKADWHLHPKMIVEHITETATMQQAWNIFRPSSSSSYPQVNLCAHYIVSRQGNIYQLVPTSIRCRHTIGLNYTAIGIENVAWSDHDFLGRARQVSATVRLSKWLACRYHIKNANIIGHGEANRHPWFLDHTGQRNDHTDMSSPAMHKMRRWISQAGC